MIQELRRNQRVLLDVDVDLVQGETHAPARAQDISLGGMFVRCTMQAPFGTPVTLSFRLPTSEQELVLSAIVRWKRDDGLGVQFLACGVRETHAITEWVKQQTT